MLTKLRERGQDEKGFTLIELLVVMLILGILAAIAIPSFFNQRDKARDSDAKATARTAQTAMETYATDNGGSYAAVAVADLEAIESTLPANITVVSTDDTYSVQAESDTGNGFRIARDGTGNTVYTCGTSVALPGAFLATSGGGCPDTLIWPGG